MRRKRGVSLLEIILIIGLVGLLTACGTLRFKLKVENKLATAQEAGYQIMFRVLKEIPEGETKERLKVTSEVEFRTIRADLDNEELPIDATYLKSKLYTWIKKGLDDFGTSMSEADKRLILKTRDFFALEGGYEATPEQRIVGQAFCDGVLEVLE